jgi:hypothetical protein
MESTSRDRRVPSRFGIDPTINPMVYIRKVGVADAVVAPFGQSSTQHSFTIAIE